ncbi:Complex 1 LYR protein [Ostreococcus tauri]|jgi:LYR motif-containing protein 4|uniref:Complex 1 LYR protein n=1 Tax=Ostreococcus tauri TaxID=70448 RepID=Q01CV3_OSTTA|nr:Complex 1 LYR protein [Ostreococcus tauri]OUS43806.1 hypothetical protein BE221DRAFT_79863 [Ostreococcus tauri]CAL52850.1 Complex 1 LYR protein [Ostreococcus tauri]|eukprot:XP_003078110.1 Complex 1 LYR protein [Ostreococcus tauri]
MSSTLRLYRAVLRSANKFPSRNRGKMVEEIKTEFREGRAATDAREIETRIAAARDGLDRLNAFSNMDTTSSTWQVSLKGPHAGTD